MAINSLSPGFVNIYYTTATRTHKQTLPVIPDGVLTPGIMPDLLQYDGNPVDLDTAVNTYVDTIKGLFNTSTSFVFAELWSQPTPEDDPLFIFQVELGIVGTNAGTPVLYSQVSTTFRTHLGGLYRNVLLETIMATNLRDDFPFTNGTITALYNFLKGPTSFVYGRDGGKIVAAIRMMTKTNDMLRKRGMLDS